MKQFVAGHSVEQAFESIRLFAICEGMNWCHLPNGGGLYDQHPKLLDDWMFIFHQRHLYEEQKRQREEAQRKRDARKSGARRR